MSVNLFARWNSEATCLEEMLGLHGENAANAIVAGIKERVTTNTLFKSADSEMIVLSKAGDAEIVVIGPCSWEKVDPEDDLITAKAMSKFFNKWFNVVPERYQNITLNHKSFQAGIPLLSYQGSDGQMHFTHVHEKGAILISKVRDDDGLVQTKDLREKILNGTYKSYSIYGVPIDIAEKNIDGRDVNVINDIDPGDVTYCRAGMNDMANFGIVKAHDDDKSKPPKEEDGDDDKKAMTLEQINAKIEELRATVEANHDKINEYYNSREDTPDWVDELYADNSALYDELSAWREAKIERIVNDVKEEAAKTPSNIDKMLEEAFHPFVIKLEEKVSAIKVIQPSDSPEPLDLDKVINDALKPIFDDLMSKTAGVIIPAVPSSVSPLDINKALNDTLVPLFNEMRRKTASIIIPAVSNPAIPLDINRAVNDALLPLFNELQKKVGNMAIPVSGVAITAKDVKRLAMEAFNESVKTIEDKLIADTGSKPKAQGEVYKAMDERTLDTYLKIRDIFKELKVQ